MNQYVGEDDLVGMDEVEELLEELDIAGVDISGIDDEDLIGAVRRARRRGGIARRRAGGKLAMRKVVGLSQEGRPRQFPIMMTRQIGLADATAANISGTADRRGLCQGLFIEGNSAAGVRVYGIYVTAINVNGRNCVIGSGFVPATVAFGEFAQSAGGAGQWEFGVVDQGGQAIVTVQNDSGAAADCSGTFRCETTDA